MDELEMLKLVLEGQGGQIEKLLDTIKQSHPKMIRSDVLPQTDGQVRDAIEKLFTLIIKAQVLLKEIQESNTQALHHLKQAGL